MTKLINVFLYFTGTASGYQSARILCPSNASPLCAWRGPASVPLLHHPLTMEGQRGPPLSTGPAALIWAPKGLRVGGKEERGGGARVGGEGEGRGWTHSLLLIIDQYMHWSPLIPDRFKPPLLSLPAHQSALQQHGGIGEVEGKRYDWTDFLYFCLVLSFILQRQKQVLHFMVNHAPCDIQPFGATDCSGTSKTKCITFTQKK